MLMISDMVSRISDLGFRASDLGFGLGHPGLQEDVLWAWSPKRDTYFRLFGPLS